MVFESKHKNINIISLKQINKKSFNAIFFKNLCLRKINFRLIINKPADSLIKMKVSNKKYNFIVSILLCYLIY